MFRRTRKQGHRYPRPYGHLKKALQKNSILAELTRPECIMGKWQDVLMYLSAGGKAREK